MQHYLYLSSPGGQRCYMFDSVMAQIELAKLVQLWPASRPFDYLSDSIMR